ncbi:EF-Hand 1, calcium-binding site [Phytophthora cactorum]|nr:EF-Hand 1, calcium-binding site [Phytophthora cactorum]
MARGPPPGMPPRGFPPGMAPPGMAPPGAMPPGMPPGLPPRGPPGAPPGMPPRAGMPPPGMPPGMQGAPPRRPPPGFPPTSRGPPGAPGMPPPRAPPGPPDAAPPSEALQATVSEPVKFAPPRGPPGVPPPRGPPGVPPMGMMPRGLPPRGPPGGFPPTATAATPSTGGALAARFGKLTVKVLRAFDLKKLGMMDTADPYVKLTIGTQNVQTKVQEGGGKTPEFNENFDFNIATEKELVLEVWDQEKGGQDRFMAQAKVEIVPWLAKGGFEGDIELRDREGSPAGKLAIVAKFTKPEAGAAGPVKAPPMAPPILSDPNGKFTDKEILEAFQAFDLDHNNYVGAAEIRHVLINIGEAPTDEEVDEMIKMVDKDGDGQVSFAEFYAMVTKGKQPPPGLGVTAAVPEKAAAPGGAVSGAQAIQLRNQRKVALEEFARDNGIKPESVKKAYKRFQATDKDGSGQIDYSEFCEVLQVDPSPQCEKVFQLFDNDKTGRIDVREFMIALSNFTGAEKEEKLKFAFLVFDEDGNGVITRQELMKILKANHMASNESEVSRKADTIMSQGDKDGDGVISFDEFSVVSKKFPNILFPAYTLGTAKDYKDSHVNRMKRGRVATRGSTRRALRRKNVVVDEEDEDEAEDASQGEEEEAEEEEEEKTPPPKLTRAQAKKQEAEAKKNKKSTQKKAKTKKETDEDDEEQEEDEAEDDEDEDEEEEEEADVEERRRGVRGRGGRKRQLRGSKPPPRKKQKRKIIDSEDEEEANEEEDEDDEEEEEAEEGTEEDDDEDDEEEEEEVEEVKPRTRKMRKEESKTTPRGKTRAKTAPTEKKAPPEKKQPMKRRQAPKKIEESAESEDENDEEKEEQDDATSETKEEKPSSDPPSAAATPSSSPAKRKGLSINTLMNDADEEDDQEEQEDVDMTPASASASDTGTDADEVPDQHFREALSGATTEPKLMEVLTEACGRLIRESKSPSRLFAVALLGAVKEDPKRFSQPVVLKYLLRLLRSKHYAGMKDPSDHGKKPTAVTALGSGHLSGSTEYFQISLPVLVTNLLVQVMKDVDEWPVDSVKVFLDDSLSSRVWVDHELSQLFVQNVKTVLETDGSEKQATQPLVRKRFQGATVVQEMRDLITHHVRSRLVELEKEKPGSIGGSSGIGGNHAVRNMIMTLADCARPSERSIEQNRGALQVNEPQDIATVDLLLKLKLKSTMFQLKVEAITHLVCNNPVYLKRALSIFIARERPNNMSRDVDNIKMLQHIFRASRSMSASSILGSPDDLFYRRPIEHQGTLASRELARVFREMASVTEVAPVLKTIVRKILKQLTFEQVDIKALCVGILDNDGHWDALAGDARVLDYMGLVTGVVWLILLMRGAAVKSLQIQQSNANNRQVSRANRLGPQKGKQSLGKSSLSSGHTSIGSGGGASGGHGPSGSGSGNGTGASSEGSKTVKISVWAKEELQQALAFVQREAIVCCRDVLKHFGLNGDSPFEKMLYESIVKKLLFLDIPSDVQPTEHDRTCFQSTKEDIPVHEDSLELLTSLYNSCRAIDRVEALRTLETIVFRGAEAHMHREALWRHHEEIWLLARVRTAVVTTQPRRSFGDRRPLMLFDANGLARQPPPAILEHLRTLDHKFKLGMRLRQSRKKDFLMEMVAGNDDKNAVQNAGAAANSAWWIADIVCEDFDTVQYLPYGCLCQLLLLAVRPSSKNRSDSQAQVPLNQPALAQIIPRLLTKLREYLAGGNDNSDVAPNVVLYYLECLNSPELSTRRVAAHILYLLTAPRSVEELSEEIHQVVGAESAQSFSWLRELAKLPCYSSIRSKIFRSLENLLELEASIPSLRMSGAYGRLLAGRDLVATLLLKDRDIFAITAEVIWRAIESQLEIAPQLKATSGISFSDCKVFYVTDGANTIREIKLPLAIIHGAIQVLCSPHAHTDPSTTASSDNNRTATCLARLTQSLFPRATSNAAILSSTGLVATKDSRLYPDQFLAKLAAAASSTTSHLALLLFVRSKCLRHVNSLSPGVLEKLKLLREWLQERSRSKSNMVTDEEDEEALLLSEGFTAFKIQTSASSITPSTGSFYTEPMEESARKSTTSRLESTKTDLEVFKDAYFGHKGDGAAAVDSAPLLEGVVKELKRSSRTGSLPNVIAPEDFVYAASQAVRRSCPKRDDSVTHSPADLWTLHMSLLHFAGSSCNSDAAAAQLAKALLLVVGHLPTCSSAAHRKECSGFVRRALDNLSEGFAGSYSASVSFIRHLAQVSTTEGLFVLEDLTVAFDVFTVLQLVVQFIDRTVARWKAQGVSLRLDAMALHSLVVLVKEVEVLQRLQKGKNAGKTTESCAIDLLASIAHDQADDTTMLNLLDPIMTVDPHLGNLGDVVAIHGDVKRELIGALYFQNPKVVAGLLDMLNPDWESLVNFDLSGDQQHELVIRDRRLLSQVDDILRDLTRDGSEVVERFRELTRCHPMLVLSRFPRQLMQHFGTVSLSQLYLNTTFFQNIMCAMQIMRPHMRHRQSVLEPFCHFLFDILRVIADHHAVEFHQLVSHTWEFFYDALETDFDLASELIFSAPRVILLDSIVNMYESQPETVAFGEVMAQRHNEWSLRASLESIRAGRKHHGATSQQQQIEQLLTRIESQELVSGTGKPLTERTDMTAVTQGLQAIDLLCVKTDQGASVVALLRRCAAPVASLLVTETVTKAVMATLCQTLLNLMKYDSVCVDDVMRQYVQCLRVVRPGLKEAAVNTVLEFLVFADARQRRQILQQLFDDPSEIAKSKLGVYLKSAAFRTTLLVASKT